MLLQPALTMRIANVSKLSPRGEVMITWSGRVLAQRGPEVVIEAIWQRAALDLGYVAFQPGDRFVEHFYADRGYNVFSIYAGESGAHKGWYCNITEPAELVDLPDGSLLVRAVDLALDYFRQPEGRELILDEDELLALGLPASEVEAAWAALAELRRLAEARQGPFAPGADLVR
jgi:predicted RNA-binding protein associated with RNAse of E/G family